MSAAAELRQYQARVEEAMAHALSSHEPEIFENEGPEHARIVLDTMLNNAHDTLDVVAGSMDHCAWSVQQLRRFLDQSPRSRARVLLTADVNNLPETSVLRDIKHHHRVDIRPLPLNIGRHFAIVDGQHVRLEYNLATRAASVTFADPGGVGRAVSSLFDRLWGAAERQNTTVSRSV